MNKAFLRTLSLLAALAACLASHGVGASIISESDKHSPSVVDSGELPEVRWIIETVNRGDSLSRIFKRAGFSAKIALRLPSIRGTRLLHVIMPGDEVRFAHNAAGDLIGVEFRRGANKRLSFLVVDSSIELLGKDVIKSAGSLHALLVREFELNKETQKTIALPKPEYDESLLRWTSVDIRRGDSLTAIFKRIGLPVAKAIEIAETARGTWLRKMKPGMEVRIARSADGEFAVLSVNTSPLTVRKVIAGDGYLFHTEVKSKPDTQLHQGCGAVKTNLFDAGKSAGFNNRTLGEYIDIYSSSVDFARETRKGDEFCMIYEQDYTQGGTPVGKPRIIAASLKNSRGVFNAIRFEDPVLGVSYYDEDGENLHREFLRSPIAYGRVSSRFTNRRFHPILKKWRAHKGVDYSARIGTPVMSTAKGTIQKIGYDGAYGNVIYIRHGSKFETVYAHLNGFARGMRRGTTVARGEVIGYVGNTGLSTGPHLHYEFRVNARHRDPLTYPLPKGKPVPEEHRAKFIESASLWKEHLGSIDKTKSQLAYTPSAISPIRADQPAAPAEGSQQQ